MFAEVNKIVNFVGKGGGERKLREVEVFGFIGEEEFDVAAFCDFDGVGDGVRLFGKEGFHFGGAFEVELIAGIAVSVWVGNQGAALKAGEHIVCFSVFLFDVVHVVGCYEGESGFLGENKEVSVGGFFVSVAVVHEFEEEVIGAEDVGIFEGDFFGAFEVFVATGFVDFASEVAGESDEAFGVFAEQVFVDSRFVIHAFEVGAGDEFYEVVVSGLVFGQ